MDRLGFSGLKAVNLPRAARSALWWLAIDLATRLFGFVEEDWSHPRADQHLGSAHASGTGTDHGNDWFSHGRCPR